MTDFYDEDDRHYTYVVTRDDISGSDACVQSGHAILEHYRDEHSSKGLHPALVMLKVDTEDLLSAIELQLQYADCHVTSFVENYGKLQGQLTAICAGPIPHDDAIRKIFRSTRMLRVYHDVG